MYSLFFGGGWCGGHYSLNNKYKNYLRSIHIVVDIMSNLEMIETIQEGA